MEEIKVCLVFPRFRYISGDPPLGIGYLAAYLQKNLSCTDVSIIDTTFRHSYQAVLGRVKEIKPQVLGIYSDELMTRGALAISDWARDNGIYTVFGGPQATVLPEVFMPHADALVRGEGEVALTELLKRYPSQDLSHIPGIWWRKGDEIIRNLPTQTFVNLDDLPFPRRELLQMDKYLYYWNYLDAVDIRRRGTTMMVSRGCPFSCSYCQPIIREMFGEAVRFRSPDNVVEEITMLNRQYGINSIFFHDDTFTANHAWLREFCRRMDAERMPVLWGCNSRVDTVTEDTLRMMYGVGLRNIHFGIESASQRVLDSVYNKKINLDQVKEAVALTHKIGICTMGFFMLGAPSETREEINRTISFARGLRLEEASFSLTTPLAGTYLYQALSRDSRYKIDSNYENYNYYSKYIIRGGISNARIKLLQVKAFLLFYLHPFRLGYIAKHLLRPRGIRKLFNKISRTL